MPGADAPDMEVGDAIVVALQAIADRGGKLGIRGGIEQHGAGVAHQAP